MTQISRRTLLAAGSVAPLLGQSGGGNQSSSNSQIIFIGTYTKGSSKGIYTSRFDPGTGELTALQLAAETPNPTFLAYSPDRKFLYAVNEVGNYNGTHHGSLTSFAVEHNSQLKAVNTVDSGGSGPCHLAVDGTGHAVITANYGSGSAASYSIHGGGELSTAVSKFQYEGHSVNPERQEKPHAHCATVSPDNKYVLINDLGLDRIHVYHLDASTAELKPNDPAYWSAQPGVGPRHLVFHPNGKFVYSVNEMKYDVDVLSWDSGSGVLKTVQSVSSLPADFKGENTAAEIAIDSKGKFVYVSNRGNDSIAIFSVDPQNFTLTLVANTSSGGRTPRHFTLDPSERWLLAANQDGNNIVIFRRDPSTGLIAATGKTYSVGAPVCLLFA